MTLVAAVPPIMTAASLEKPLPVIETAVPPVVLPALGEIAKIETEDGVGVIGWSEAQPAATVSRRVTTPRWI
jgi:hypothetical protein